MVSEYDELNVHLVSKIELVDPASLIPYAKNSKKHSPSQIKEIAASILKFGFNRPVLVSDDPPEIAAGHGCTEAALLLKLRKIPIIKLSHLTEGQRRAYLIADNKLAEKSEWDNDVLSDELAELVSDGFDDLEVIGFDDDELTELLGDDFIQVEGHWRKRHSHSVPDTPDDSDDDDEKIDVVISKPGYKWFMGDHVLVVGSSRVAEVDQVIKRWQKLTGADAKLESGETFNKLKKSLKV